MKLNALENATSVYAFDEAQNKTLTAAIAVDAVNPGTYTSFPSGSAKVAVGTVVDSHLIHSDIPSRNYTARRTGIGDVRRTTILGVVASTAKLAASDNLGAPGTQYAGTTQWRGLESSENGWSSLGDKFTISADRDAHVRHQHLRHGRVPRPHEARRTSSSPRSPTRPTRCRPATTSRTPLTVTNTGACGGTERPGSRHVPGRDARVRTASGGCTGTTTVTCSLGTIASGGNASGDDRREEPEHGARQRQHHQHRNLASGPEPGRNRRRPQSSSPSLTTTITDAPDPVTAGNDVQYTLTVTNNGIAAVADAHVVDTLPPGTTLMTAPRAGGCTGTGPVDCTLGPLAVGASARPQLVVTSPSTVPVRRHDHELRRRDAGQQHGRHAGHDGRGTGRRRLEGLRLPRRLAHDPGRQPGDADAARTPATARRSSITQGDGTLLRRSVRGPVHGRSRRSPATATRTTRSTLDLTYNFPDSPTSLTDAATAYGATIYKNTDPDNPSVGSVVPFCSDARCRRGGPGSVRRRSVDLAAEHRTLRGHVQDPLPLGRPEVRQAVALAVECGTGSALPVPHSVLCAHLGSSG